jgi:hypothetical protein
MRSYIVLRIKSLVEVTWSHGLNSPVLKWFKSHAQAVFAQREETKLIVSPYEVILRRSDIWRHWGLKWLKWLYSFDLEFRICRTIKRDANLVGLRKIESSSIKTKSKERHSSTPRARRIVFGSVGVGSPDVSRESQRVVRRPWSSWVPTWVRSPDAEVCARTLVRSPDAHWESRCQANRFHARIGCALTSAVPTLGSLLTHALGVPTWVRSPDVSLITRGLLTWMNSVFFIRRESRDLHRESRRRSEWLDFN